jgi:glucosamine kinase
MNTSRQWPIHYGSDVETQVAGPYVVGVDAGATTTRCVVMASSGTIAGYGRGPGANRNSGGDTVTSLTTALRTALRDMNRSHIAGGVFGIAGAGAAGRAAAVHAATEAWRTCGLAGAPSVVTDITVAFAAGTNAPTGIVVFSGTGAGAAVVDHGKIIRRADAYGWLVGDEGSAVWLGREAVRATLKAHDGRGEPTILAEMVPEALFGQAARELAPVPTLAVQTRNAEVAVVDRPRTATLGGGDIAQAIIKEVYGQPPAALGRLAPVVCQAALDGDPVAMDITEEAARWLLMDVEAVIPALPDIAPGRKPDYPVVLAGSVLSGGPVADAVRAGLRERFATEPSEAGDGAVGAAGMALQRYGLAAIA